MHQWAWGGGTGYLAVMTLVGVSAVTMTPTELLLNLVVTGAALLHFGLARRLQWRLFLPFLLPAIPAAFFGGLVTADHHFFLGILAATLTGAALTMLRNAPNAQEQGKIPNQGRLWPVATIVVRMQKPETCARQPDLGGIHIKNSPAKLILKLRAYK